MEGGGIYARVGLLIVAATVALVGMVWFFGGRNGTQGERFETYFSESVQGVDVGTPVRFRGVLLGRVTQIGLVTAIYKVPVDSDRATARLIVVRFTIDPSRIGTQTDIAQAVKYGLRARLASQGITGLSYIELDFVSPERFPPLNLPWTPQFAYIPSVPSTLLQVQDAAQQILNKLQSVDFGHIAESITGLLDDLRGQLHDGDLHKAIVQATTLMQSLQQQVEGADLPGLSTSLRQAADSVKGTLQGKEMRDTLASAATATARLADASARLPALIAALQQTVARVNNGTADVERDLLPLLRDTRAAAANLRDTTEQLRRAPSQTLFGAPPPRTQGDGR